MPMALEVRTDVDNYEERCGGPSSAQEGSLQTSSTVHSKLRAAKRGK